VEKFVFVNLIPTLPHIMRNVELPMTTLNTVRSLLTSGNILPVMVPPSFEDLGDIIGITKARCPGGHYNKDGQVKIAEYLLQKFI
jgi:hypothetical protein